MSDATMLPPSSGRTGKKIEEAPAEVDEDQRAKCVPSKRGIGHAQRVHQDQRQRSDENAHGRTSGAHHEASTRAHGLLLFPPRQPPQGDELDARLPSECASDQSMPELVHEDALEHDDDPNHQPSPALFAVQSPQPERHQPKPEVNANWNSEQAELDAHRGDYGSRTTLRPVAMITGAVILQIFASLWPPTHRSRIGSSRDLARGSARARSR